MARHRNLRGRLHSYDDNYNDDPDLFQDDDDDYRGGSSQQQRSTLGTFMEPPAKSHEEMEACFFAVCDRVPSFPDSAVNDAIFDHNFDIEESVASLLNGDYGFPDGWNAGSGPPAATKSPSPAAGVDTATSRTTTPVSGSPANGEASAAGDGGSDATGPTFGHSPPRGGVVVMLGPSPAKPTKQQRSSAAGEDGAAAGAGGGAGAGADGPTLRDVPNMRHLDGYAVDDGRDIDEPDRKPVINLVIVGHVDAGKSTLMGHLLYKLGGVSSKALHKFKTDAKVAGKASFAYAWVLDQHAEERSRGVTMDVGTNFFETRSRRFVLLDAPGHKDFIPNMITGAAQADAAVLVVPAKPDEFEDAFSEAGQTREHATLLRSLGVKRLVVAINKMDMVDWNKARFKEIKQVVAAFLERAGFKASNVTYVPVSGIDGINLDAPMAELGRKYKWHTGPCLLDALDSLPEASRPTDKPLRLCISDVYKRMGLGVTVAGKIESGRILPGNRVLILPSNESAGVKGLEINKKPVHVAVAGENVEVGLGGVTAENLRPGQVLCHPRHPIPLAMKIKAQVFTLPSLRVPLVAGQQLTFHMHHLEEPCNVTKLLRIISKKNGRTKVRRPRCVLRGQTASVRIKFLRPLPLEAFADNRRLGRFMLRYAGDTVAAGLVKSIMK